MSDPSRPDASSSAVVGSSAVGSAVVELGPPGLGLRVDARPTTDAPGALVLGVVADPTLEGPPGVLQGGFASLLPALVARRLDAHGAPLTALTARLRAPTPLGRRLRVAVRSASGARHAVRVEDPTQDGRLLVEAEVEFAGPGSGAGSDLVALARSRALDADAPEPHEPPDDDPHPTCFVCGRASAHPSALRLAARPLGDDAVAVGWVAEEAIAGASLAMVREAVADEPGVVDELVLAAVLDCASARAALPLARAAGFGGVVLGTFGLRALAPVPVLDPVRVVARVDGRDGRRIGARAAIVDDDGAVLAAASVVQVAVPEMPGLGEVAPVDAAG